MIKIEIFFDGEYWCAKALEESIFTQAKSIDELYKNIREAIYLHFEEEIEKGNIPEVLIISEIPKEQLLA